MTQSQTLAFRLSVSARMGPAPPVVPPETALEEAVRRMSEASASSVVVADAAGTPLGILTEQDVVRRVAFRRDAAAPVSAAMSTPLQAVRADDLLFHAIARMRRAGLRHLPVVDAGDRIVGALQLDNALATVSHQLVGQIDRLTGPETPEGMTDVRAAQLDVATELLDDGVPAPEIQGLVSHINIDVYARMTSYCVTELEREGLGPPPRSFCLIVMGSGGRGESYLNPDQDNGFIIADYPDSEHDAIDGYFRALAERLTRTMDAVGMPLCDGDVMATNPLWRKTASQWRAQLDYWLRRRNPMTLALSDIFFDFRPAYGDYPLATGLRTYVTDRLRGNHTVIREMYVKDDQFKVALGLFNRFIVERHKAEHLGQINLKAGGTLPLVDAVRAYALLHGVRETSTLARITALRDGDVLSGDEADYLTGACHTICAILLTRQMADQRAGIAVSNYVDPDGLSSRERDNLVQALKAVDRLRDRLRTELTGDIF